MHCRCECKMAQPLWKTAWQLLNILNVELTSDPAIPLLGLYPKELKEGTPTDIYTLMFIAASFTIAKGRNNANVHWHMNG